MSYSCQHCDQFDQIIKSSGYVVEKLPKNLSNSKGKHKVSLDKNLPVILCGYPECQAQCRLESSLFPENILQLRDDESGDGDENYLQSNQYVTVNSCAGQAQIDEVLQWLNRISGSDTLPQRSNTSYSRIISLSRKNSITSMNNNVKLLVEKTERMIERQEQALSDISVLRK